MPLRQNRGELTCALRVFQVSSSKRALIASMRVRAFSLVGSGTLEGALPQESMRASAAPAFAALPNLPRPCGAETLVPWHCFYLDLPAPELLQAGMVDELLHVLEGEDLSLCGDE